MTEHHRIAIVGTGFSGLGMAIKLKQEGERRLRAPRAGRRRRRHLAGQHLPGLPLRRAVAPLLVLLRAEPELVQHLLAAGGDPRLPAATAPSASACCRTCASTPSSRAPTGTATRRCWRIETSAGPITADVLVAAQGPLSEPTLPEVPGLEDFEGTAFHSAQWDHDHDLAGERVAVIGTGASAIQFVPEIQPKVGRLHVFQRTRAVGRAPPEPPAQAAGSARSTGASRRRSWRCAPAIYWARELVRAAASATRAVDRLLEQLALAPHARSRSRIPSCARS